MEKALFERLVTGLEQMIDIEKGNIEVPAQQIHQFKLPDVKQIRLKNQLKQSEFAQLLGVSTSLVQSWELHRRLPNGPALKLLNMIELQPQLIHTLQKI